MHRRLWLLTGALAAALLVASAAAATGSALRGTPAAAPFAPARVPQSAAERSAKSVLVFGQEQDVNGFNTQLTCCSQSWAGLTGNVPEIRGAYLVDNKLRRVPDLVTSGTATKTSLSFTIRPNAYWYWGGKKLPVTYRDFVYTWQQLADPENDVVSHDGYDAITGYTHKGDRKITFTWKKPYADWQDLFSIVYPAEALAGLDFNRIWTNCVCGNDGKPVADGPFYMASYTKGQGSTLKANPYWYGSKPGLKEIDFRIITDVNSEIQAMRGGELDAINPSFGSNLSQLVGVSGITYDQVPGLYQEHIDLQFGAKGNPLLKAPWFRHAIMLSIDRPAIIKTVYGPLAGSTPPLNSLLYYPSDASYKPAFAKWSYDPAQALALLKKHCTGGPTKVDQGNSKTWTCSNVKASVRYTWTSGNPTRATQEAIIKAELKSVGVEVVDNPVPANVIFGPTGIPSGDYDLANFAWSTPPDPANFANNWSCGGESNYLHYCNRKVTKLLEEADSELDPARRAADYQQADALMANDLPSIPMYSRPIALVRKSDVLGMVNNPAFDGFAWNIENWHWRS